MFDDSGFDHHSAPPGSYIYNEEGRAHKRITVKARIDRRLKDGQYSKENGYHRTKSGSVSISAKNAQTAFQHALDPELLMVYSVWMGRDKTLPVSAWVVAASEELDGAKGLDTILKMISEDPNKEEAAKIKAINTLYDKELTRRNITDDPEVIRLRAEHAAWVAHLKAEQAAKEKAEKDAAFWERVAKHEENNPTTLIHYSLRGLTKDSPLSRWGRDHSHIGGPKCLADWEQNKERILREQDYHRRPYRSSKIDSKTQEFYTYLLLDPSDEEFEDLSRRLAEAREAYAASIVKYREDLATYEERKIERDLEMATNPAFDWLTFHLKPHLPIKVEAHEAYQVSRWFSALGILIPPRDLTPLYQMLGAYRAKKNGWTIKKRDRNQRKRRRNRRPRFTDS